ncbi:MAG: type I secretion system permease/ATPase [Thiohalomonadaceae bacterium]
MRTQQASKPMSLASLVGKWRGITAFLCAVSGLVNLLALTGAFYMLQVYDRVLTSGSMETLLALSLLALMLYLFQGLFDVIRAQVLVRVGARLDWRAAPLAHRVALTLPRLGHSSAELLERGRDVDRVRAFLGSPGPLALFDLPWVPVFLGFVYLLHPLLGLVTLGGAAFLALLAVASERVTRPLSGAAQQAALARDALAEGNVRNAEMLSAMGMTRRAVERFGAANDRHLLLQARSSAAGGGLGAVARVLRMTLQSSILGLGAWLVIAGELSAGAIIAASVASARALAPIDLAIGNWKSMVQARCAWQRVRETVAAANTAAPRLPLPAPRQHLGVEHVTVAAPASGRILLADVGFTLQAGQALGVVGPSGSGKTTLARVLTGVWPTLRGSIRLDGAALDQWDEEQLGRHIGYLPQDASLTDATIAENISRHDPAPQAEAIIEAARAAGVHDMIVRLPESYQTRVGPQGGALSAGQRQRIGLARALYGKPFLVVLDEPNANLDREGEAALAEAIHAIRARGGMVVVITHRTSVLAVMDYLAVVQEGRLAAFGPRGDVLVPGRAAPPPRPVAGSAS